jgi:hypothetical protein
MPETTDSDLMLPPVLPGEELANLDAVDKELLEEEEEETTEAAAPKKQYKKRKKTPKEVVEKQKHSKEMDIDEWIADVDKKFNWDRPGMECQIHRTYPEWENKVRVGGLVIKREGGVFDPGWVAEEFGGGEYEMHAIIPPDGPNRPPTKRKKKFSIAGRPKVSSMQQPNSTDGAPQQQDENLNHPVVQRGMLGFMSESQKELVSALKGGGQAGPDIEQLKAPYERAMATMQESYEQKAQAREDAAAQATRAAELRAQEAKLEAEAAKRERDKTAEETRQRIQEATQGSNTMLAALLPSFNENASKQVDSITATFAARETNIEQRHAQELESLRRYHDSQVQQLQTLQAAEVSRMEATFQSQLGLLQQQLQHFQQQAQIYQAESLKLQNEMMQMRMGQIEQLKTSQDPITKLTEMQQITEVMKDVMPGLGGGGGDGSDLGEDAPAWAKMINNAVNQLGGPIAAVLQAKADPQQQMMHPGMMPQQQMMPPQGAMVQQPPQQRPMPPQEPPGPPPTRLKREDVVEMVGIMGNIYKSGSTTPEQAAQAALQSLPHDVMRVLSRKEPTKVLAEFEAAGVLAGSPLLENAGQEFAIQVLTHMRKSL